MTLPLAGVRILDLTQYLPFSYGSQLLVNLGAEVLKVEPPQGELGRSMTTTFTAVNRGKRSVTLDLKDQAEVDRFLELVAEFDVVFESFRPGVLARLGLAPESLLARNPKLVICSATGYGQDGPYAQRPGHDGNYLAVAGALLPSAAAPPTLPALPVADMATGVFCALTIVAGVMAARTAGRGQHIDLAMSDVAVSMNMFAVASGLSGSAGLPWPEIVTGECPCYGAFRTSDDRWIMLGNIEPKFWKAFLDALGLPQYGADALATGERAHAVRAELAEIIAGRPAEHWDQVFSALEICYSPLHHISAVPDDPHMQHRDVLRRVGPAWTTRYPAHFGAWPTAETGAVPDLGEANSSVLNDAGREL
jgi:alpha-methylacyl-CoA racemase